MGSLLDEVLSAGIIGFERALSQLNVTPQEFVQWQEGRIALLEPTLRALVARGPHHEVKTDLAVRTAIRLAVKDNIDVAGLPSTSGSPTYGDAPANRSASVVEKWVESGGSILAKTNMDECALGGNCSNTLFGATLNPWFGEGTPGGSSGGSAVAVAAGYCHVGVGTDTGGSIRNPAAMSGIIAFKPTWGTTSLRGIHPQAWSLDTIGVLGRSVEDCYITWRVMKGDLDLRRAGHAWPTTTEASPRRAQRVGIITALFEQMEPRAASIAHNWLEDLRDVYDIEEVDLVVGDDAMAACLAIIVSEFAAAWRSRPTEGLTSGVKSVLSAGSQVSAVEYIDAQRYRTSLIDTLVRTMGTYDVLIAPTMGVMASPTGYESLGAESNESGFASPMWNRAARYTTPWSLSGQPVVAMPVLEQGEGPGLSMQLIGAWNRERQLIDFARGFRQRLGLGDIRGPAWVSAMVSSARTPPIKPPEHDDSYAD